MLPTVVWIAARLPHVDVQTCLSRIFSHAEGDDMQRGFLRFRFHGRNANKTPSCHGGWDIALSAMLQGILGGRQHFRRPAATIATTIPGGPPATRLRASYLLVRELALFLRAYAHAYVRRYGAFHTTTRHLGARTFTPQRFRCLFLRCTHTAHAPCGNIQARLAPISVYAAHYQRVKFISPPPVANPRHPFLHGALPP